MHTEPHQTEHLSATVAVRVSRTDDGTLLESAQRRLERSTGVEKASITSVDRISPRTNAVELCLSVRLAITADPNLATLRDRDALGPGVSLRCEEGSAGAESG